MADKQYKALENGTMSNPYRFIKQGDTPYLNDEEQEFYKGCKWLVPLKVAKELEANPQPLMSHMNIKEPGNRLGTAMAAIEQLPVDPAYAAQMQAIKLGEQIADGTAEKPETFKTTEETTTPSGTAQGTGNQTVI